MRWNATFSYQKSASTTHDDNGFIHQNESNAFIDGTLCQFERGGSAQHRIGEDGQEFVYSYTAYIPTPYSTEIAIGDTMRFLLHNEQTITATVLGINSLNKRYLIVWL